MAQPASGKEKGVGKEKGKRKGVAYIQPSFLRFAFPSDLLENDAKEAGLMLREKPTDYGQQKD